MTPPFEGPDEPQHYAYIEWLVEHNEFPPQGRASWDTPVQQESSQPPLYYLLASIPARLVGVSNPRAEYRPNPHPFLGFPLLYPDNDNRAIHYPQDASPLAGGWLALYLSRGVTAGFGVLLIVSVYGLARQAVPGQRQVALLSAFLVATIPQVVYLSGLVSNDIPVAAMSTVLLWMVAAFIRKGDSKWLALGIGIVTGLSVLIKGQRSADGHSCWPGFSMVGVFPPTDVAQYRSFRLPGCRWCSAYSRLVVCPLLDHVWITAGVGNPRSGSMGNR